MNPGNAKLHLTLTLCVFVLFGTACEDKKKDAVEFGTASEAQQSYQQLEDGETDPLEIVNKVLDAAVLSETFDGTSSFGKKRFGKKQSLLKGQSIQFTYDSGSGYWTLDADTTENGVNISLFHRVRYTPRGLFGFATELTDRMEYETNIDIDGLVVEEGDSVQVDLSYSEDYDIQSDLPFVSDTNFITITGKTTASSQFTADGFTVTASYRYDVESLRLFGPFNEDDDEVDYPQSGSLDFTVEYDVIGPNLTADYFVGGKITFDGDETALLEYGGHTFILNLDDGTITPA